MTDIAIAIALQTLFIVIILLIIMVLLLDIDEEVKRIEKNDSLDVADVHSDSGDSTGEKEK